MKNIFLIPWFYVGVGAASIIVGVMIPAAIDVCAVIALICLIAAIMVGTGLISKIINRK